MKRVVCSVLSVLLIGGLGSGCKEEPPPPPKPIARPDQAGSANPGAAASAMRKGPSMPRISNFTMKQYRVEACYYGSLGLTKARDAYNASLGGAEPSAEKLPSFGDYGTSNNPHGRMALAGPQLPFMRHVRSCSVAKSRPQPAFAGVDDAITTFEGYAGKLNRLIVEASRYYARKQFEKDEMKRGKQLHKELTELFAQLDEKLGALDKAVRPWQDKLPKPTEKLDKSGELATAALVEARKLVRMFMEPTRDTAAVRTQLDAHAKAIAALEARSKEASNEPHSLKMLAELKALQAAIEAVHEESGALDSDKRYTLTAAMTSVIDANQRALQQLLRQRGDLKPGAPFRMMNPRMKRPQMRPNMRIKTPATAGAKTPPANDPK